MKQVLCSPTLLFFQGCSPISFTPFILIPWKTHHEKPIMKNPSCFIIIPLHHHPMNRKNPWSPSWNPSIWVMFHSIFHIFLPVLVIFRNPIGDSHSSPSMPSSSWRLRSAACRWPHPSHRRHGPRRASPKRVMQKNHLQMGQNQPEIFRFGLLLPT